MKNCFLLAAIGVICSASTAFAHAPTKIDIVYDPSGKVVAAVITHPVDDPKSHNIGKIDVSLNGKEILTHTISVQDNANTQTVTYRIPDAKPGDRIEVEAYCNWTGTLEKEVEVK